MATCSFLFLFFLLLGISPEGHTAVIQTQQTVVAAVGEEVRFSCQLTQSKDVLQVTWQKMSPEGKKNLGSYSKYSGQRVTSGFRGKLEIRDVRLHNCSIVISQVTEQDEGCYFCLFNTYPDGSIIGRTCLILSELHEPSLHVRESNLTGESVVSCSATGRPAPTVTLTVSQMPLNLSHNNTVSVSNNNGTVTVTTTAVLPGFHESGAQVGCAARVLSAQKDVFMMIPEVRQTPADGSDQESGYKDSNFLLTLVLSCVGVGVTLIIFIILLIFRSSLSQQDGKKSRTPRTVEEAPKQFVEQVRKQTSPKRSENSPHLEPLTHKKEVSGPT